MGVKLPPFIKNPLKCPSINPFRIKGLLKVLPLIPLPWQLNCNTSFGAEIETIAQLFSATENFVASDFIPLGLCPHPRIAMIRPT
jgi:hypothetical protein